MLTYDEKESVISVFDQAGQSLLSYSINHNDNKLLSFLEEKSFREQTGVTRKAWNISPDTYLVDGQLGEPSKELKRFQILSGNEVTSEYNEFPVPASEHMIHISSLISMSPNRNKAAVGTLYGGILEIFNIQNNLNPVCTRRFYRPVIEVKGGDIRNTPETIFGFSEIYATNEHLYTVLIGSNDPNSPHSIAQFDWKGKEIAKYSTDCLILRLFVPENEPQTAYAIANEKGFYLARFDLR